MIKNKLFFINLFFIPIFFNHLILINLFFNQNIKLTNLVVRNVIDGVNNFMDDNCKFYKMSLTLVLLIIYAKYYKIDIKNNFKVTKYSMLNTN